MQTRARFAPLARITVAAFLLAATAVVADSADAAGVFSDTAGNPHEAMIEAIAADGITGGCTADGTRFCPGNPVSRAQMASFIVRALALPPGSGDHFSDDTGSPHEPSINRLYEEGITTGFSDGTYRPGGHVSREQMASFLTRAFGLEPIEGDVFVDVSGDHEPNVNAVAEEGITRGCDSTGTYFCPGNPVQRDQMASFLGRALGYDDGTVEETPTGGQVDEQPEGDGEGSEFADDSRAGELPDSEPSNYSEPEFVGSSPSADISTTGSPQATSTEGVLAYWTDQRMAEVTGDTMEPTKGAVGEVSAQMYDFEPILSAVSNWESQVPKQVGKLYYTMSSGDPNVCSATVVARHLILTAAHCVTDAGGDYYNFLFIPQKAGVSEPLGRWAGAGQPYYFLAYKNGGAAQQVLDYALIYIPPTNTGYYIGDYTGTFPVLLNSHTLALPRYAVGYPDEGWYKQWGGTWAWFCSSNDVQWYDWGGGWASKGSGCNANGGFSGGPIFEYWNGQWWVAGVNSTMTYAPSDGSRSTHWLINLWGPSFNSWYNDLLAAAGG